ncbi:MAG TPA: AAA family ATPase, partial [Micrococcales bacterium]|uniref:DEAD/DEAH box helicase n=1 Tax=Miniimonas arenae TaxID=676201 RepID=UPI000EDDB6FD
GWIPPLASVQTLADRVTRHGTTLPQGENDVWVGSPLRVHRRCDDPMFTLSNTMAYDGLMIHATPKRGRAAAPGGEADPFNGAFGPVVAPSYWADVPAVTSGSHLQPTEIERVRRALDWLDGCGVPSSDVIAISPFRAVADALERLSHETRYSRLTAGTVHTAQGKEAPVVLLVLGGDPGRPGARAWATSRVNLFNVAVSRAQRRLYVIGDHALWKRFPYAELVARTLPVRRLGTLAGEEEEPAP